MLASAFSPQDFKRIVRIVAYGRRADERSDSIQYLRYSNLQKRWVRTTSELDRSIRQMVLRRVCPN